MRLPKIFSDNMVIQRDKPFTIWGWNEADEQVVVEIGAMRTTCVADASGHWSASIEPPPCGGPYTLSCVDSREKVEFENILVGEVWLCSGQSNMEWIVANSNDAENEIKNADYPGLRLFSVRKKGSLKRCDDIVGEWQECSSSTVKNFSAVAYFFGRMLHKTLNIPVGVINSSWGGTCIEAWMDRQVLESEEGFRPALDSLDNQIHNYSDLVDNYDEYHNKWVAEQAQFVHKRQLWMADARKARERSEPFPPFSEKPPFQLAHHNTPTSLYNGMIAPLEKFQIRGFTWYQGESNASQPNLYCKQFPAMIKSWREHWGCNDDEMPFFFVQLANFTGMLGAPINLSWSKLREAQLMTLHNVPNTGMAVAIDIGESNDIHPKNKQEVGRRLALIALAKVYGRSIVYSGPIYDHMSIEQEGLRLHFSQTGSGLAASEAAVASSDIANTANNIANTANNIANAANNIANAANNIAKSELTEKGSEEHVASPTQKPAPVQELMGFVISGADRNFKPANARIDQKSGTIIVSSDEVKSPVAVRYAWDNDPICNLFNREGLPASPFRTDSW